MHSFIRGPSFCNIFESELLVRKSCVRSDRRCFSSFPAWTTDLGNLTRREDLQEQDIIQPGEHNHSVAIENNHHSAENGCLSFSLLHISMIVGTNNGHNVLDQRPNQNV